MPASTRLHADQLDAMDPSELAADRDAYAAEAHALRRQLADAHAREVFLNNTINQLRADLECREHSAVSA